MTFDAENEKHWILALSQRIMSRTPNDWQLSAMFAQYGESKDFIGKPPNETDTHGLISWPRVNHLPQSFHSTGHFLMDGPIASNVALNVNAGTLNVAPSIDPMDFATMEIAAVPLDTAHQCPPHLSRQASSNFLT
jgi:hypothetical protein